MKTRATFVSNSSSSSFVLSTLPDENGKVTVTIDLTKFAKLLKTEEEVKDKFNEFYDIDVDDETTMGFTNNKVGKLYNYCIQEVRNNRCVMIGTIGRDLDGVLNQMDNNSKLLAIDGCVVNLK